jgi:hypothetical protein
LFVEITSRSSNLLCYPIYLHFRAWLRFFSITCVTCMMVGRTRSSLAHSLHCNRKYFTRLTKTANIILHAFHLIVFLKYIVWEICSLTPLLSSGRIYFFVDRKEKKHKCGLIPFNTHRSVFLSVKIKQTTT